MREIVRILQAIIVISALFGAVLGAQSARTFNARLTPVPIDVAMQVTISGSGQATGTLTGKTLAVSGTFQGLKSPATVARLHIGRKGVRGPALFELTVSGGTSGTLAGSFQLTEVQIAALDKQSFYIQIHSEKAPDGNLWGWLLEPEVRH